MANINPITAPGAKRTTQTGEDSLSDEQRRQSEDMCNIFWVSLDVEYLPGKTFRAPISSHYANKDLADYSLEHVQRTHPQAYLAGGWIVESCRDQEYHDRMERIRKRDAAYAPHFLEGQR